MSNTLERPLRSPAQVYANEQEQKRNGERNNSANTLVINVASIVLENTQVTASQSQKLPQQVKSMTRYVLKTTLINGVFKFLEFKELAICASLDKHWNNEVSSDPRVKLTNIIKKSIKCEKTERKDLFNIPKENSLGARIEMAKIYGGQSVVFRVLTSILTGSEGTDILNSNGVNYFFTQNLTLLCSMINIGFKLPPVFERIPSNELRQKINFIYLHRHNQVNPADCQTFIEKNQLKDDKEFFLLCPTLIQYASDKIKEDKECVLAAVCVNGPLLEFASKRLQNDVDVVSSAIGQNVNAFKFASDRLRDNEKIVLIVISFSGYLLEFASRKQQQNKKVLLALIHYNVALAIRLASEEVLNDLGMAIAVVSKLGSLSYPDLVPLFGYNCMMLDSFHKLQKEGKIIEAAKVFKKSMNW